MTVPVEGSPVRGSRRRRPGSAGRPRQRDEERASRGPRAGARRTVVDTIRQIPHYLKLLFGLVRDNRVSIADKLLVVAAIAYVLSPLDFIPDYIPFFGQVDDVFLIVTAVERLIANAGRHVVLDHWTGAVDELHDLNVGRILSAATFFLPPGIRRKLKKMAKR